MTKKKNINGFLLVFIIFLTSFLLGFYVSDKIDLNNISNKKNTTNNIIKDKFVDKNLDLNLFWQVYDIVSKNYYSSDELKSKDLEY